MIVFLEPFSNNPGMFVPAYPLQLLEIANFVSSRLPDVEIRTISLPAEYGLPLTKSAKEKVYARMIRDLEKLRPAGIGISCTAISQAKELLFLSERIKTKLPETYLFIGGYFPTLYSDEIFKRTRSIDAAVLGEGEYPCLALIQCIETGRSPQKASIPGVVFANSPLNTEPIHSARFDLSDKAALNPSLVKSAETYDLIPYAFSRGCNYRCRFCMESAIRPGRKPVPEAIVASDLKTLSETTDSRSILVSDAMFMPENVMPLIKDRRFKINFETRCDVIAPDLFARMAESCDSIALGFESASYDTLCRMNKISSRSHYNRYLDNAVALFDTAVKSEIPVVVFMIAGFPGDTAEDLKCSIDFARMLSGRTGPGGHVFKIGECRVYPRTRLWEFARKMPDVAVDDDGFFGDNVVRRASKSTDFEAIIAAAREIFSLSNITPKLLNVLLRMFPFFRMPPEALSDAILPRECFHDEERRIFRISSESLDLFRSHYADLMATYKESASDQRRKRTLRI